MTGQLSHNMDESEFIQLLESVLAREKSPNDSVSIPSPLTPLSYSGHRPRQSCHRNPSEKLLHPASLSFVSPTIDDVS